MKCVSNNFNDDYPYLQQPMIDIERPYTTYQSTKVTIIQQPTKSPATIFSNKKINAKPLKKWYKKLMLKILLLKKKMKKKLNIYHYKNKELIHIY